MFHYCVQKVEQVEHPPLLPDKHEEYYVPLSDWKVERATKKLKAKEGPYTAGEGSSDTLRSVSEPEIGHARPLLYPDSRPEPAARRAANPSIERERDAHLHPPFLL